MKLIIGLGNPGEQYGKTRHNSGWRALEFLAGKAVWREEKKLLSLVSKTKVAGQMVLLARPVTFMNNSGQAAAKLKNFYKLKKEDILIVTDDIDLPIGTVRLRARGSAGGHQGLASVLRALKSETVTRLKIGIAEGKPGIQKIASEDFVLKNFSKNGEETLLKTLRLLPDITAGWVKNKFTDTTVLITSI